jgi:hypothetical protein
MGTFVLANNKYLNSKVSGIEGYWRKEMGLKVDEKLIYGVVLIHCINENLS